MDLLARTTGALKTLLAVVLIGLVLANCVNVALRYVFKVNWIAADELQVFVMIGLAFLGTVVVSAERRQLRLDLVGQIRSASVRALIGVAEAVVTALVCGFVAYHSWAFLARVYTMGQKGGSSGVPMWLPHATVTICFIALTLLALGSLLRQLRALLARDPRRQP